MSIIVHIRSAQLLCISADLQTIFKWPGFIPYTVLYVMVFSRTRYLPGIAGVKPSLVLRDIHLDQYVDRIQSESVAFQPLRVHMRKAFPLAVTF